jgi:tellurite resistance protein TehA-like permease
VVDAHAASLEHWSDRLRLPMVVAALAALPVIVLEGSRLVIGIVVMLGGIGFIAVLTAAIAQRFVAVGGPDDAARRGRDAASGRVEHDLAALHERVRRLERHR